MPSDKLSAKTIGIIVVQLSDAIVRWDYRPNPVVISHPVSSNLNLMHQSLSCKGKGAIVTMEHRQSAHLPFLGHEAPQLCS